MSRKSVVCRLLTVIALCAALSLSPTGPASGKDSVPSTIAVLPFTMHTPADLAYLQDGIRDMFASRLAWQGKVQVVDRARTEQAMHGSKSDLSLNDALKVGSTLKADYVLFGSVTAVGQSISIDAKVASVTGNAEPIPLYGQTKSLDEVIPRISQFAQQINQKVFSRTTDQAATAAAESESASTRNPEMLIPDTMRAPDKISYLNPNFLEITPENSFRQPGLWRSQNFKGGIMGMDMGDLDGDGRLEIVTATNDKIIVHRHEALGLKAIATFNSNKMDKFLTVNVADVNHDGRAKIFVTSMRRVNQMSSFTTDSVGYGRDTLWTPASYVFQLGNGKLDVVCQDVRFFLNVVDLPKRGKVVIGQEKADDETGTLKPDIYEMQLRGSQLVPTTVVPLPKACNVFNFAKADLNNDGSEEVILVDRESRLLVLDATGAQKWKSKERYAATSNSFTGKVSDLRFNDIDYFYIPSPIVITDLNKDGIPEVVVNRSPDYSRFMPEGLKYYESAEIVSLSWDQLGMLENWKTRDMGGMVTSVRIGDFSNDGVTELVATLVLAKDYLKLWESQSSIFSYDLNVSKTKTAKQQ